MRRALLAGCVLALAVPGGATAALPTRLVVLGSDGRTAEVRLTREVMPELYSMRPTLARARGPYLLVYPLLPVGVPAQPGRFYPVTRAYCSSWRLLDPRGGLCNRLGARLVARLPRLAGFQVEPTTIAELRQNGVVQRLPRNDGTAFELAFGRTDASRRAFFPRHCRVLYTARWRGPAAARRPRRFCLGALGAYANGRLYAVRTSLTPFL